MCSVSCWYVFRQFWRCQVSSMIAKLGLLSRWSPLSSPLQRPWQCFNMFWYVKCLKCFKISWTPKNDTVVCHFDMTNINIIYYPPFRGAQLSEVLFWIRFPFFFLFKVCSTCMSCNVACLELAVPGCPSTSFSAPHGSGLAFGGVDNRTFGGSLWTLGLLSLSTGVWFFGMLMKFMQTHSVILIQFF